MSTLTISNLNDGTTTLATTYVTNGSAKVWCNWNGTSTAAIRDSFGVSSLTDNGSGDFTFAYTSSFASANYTTGGHHAHSSAITDYVYHVQLREDSAATASNARLLTVYVGATASGLQDYPNCNFTSHGDLA
tara:strand:+ start:348 stop:743 length:396 start_codon:yes stop_codon:yes gene_type:complete